MLEDLTIVVTGGAGFVGSHLCEALASVGSNRVVSIDNYFTGTRDNHVDGVEYVDAHTKDIEQAGPDAPDIVFHLGEYSRVERSFADMELVWDLNKAGTSAVLEYCRNHESKIVYAGSSTKFADGGLGRNQSPYAWTKATNTELVLNYGDWYGLDYAITYFYNVYGPREIMSGEYATVLGIFRRLFEEGQPLTVVAPGTQRRNFTHVEDIVRGLLLVGERGHGDEYGLGAERSYSMLEIAELFETEIEMMPERKGNRMDATLDIEKATLLGWRADLSVAEYIGEFATREEKD